MAEEQDIGRASFACLLLEHFGAFVIVYVSRSTDGFVSGALFFAC